MGALTGIRVTDLTHHISGPTCTMYLGDYGAEVVKIEPMEGDPSRSMNVVNLGGQRASFFAVNRSKSSIAIDLRKQKGKDIVYEMVRKSDVFVENFRPGVAERLGLSYESLREVNPRLVYCSISGFGSTGPYHDRAALDVIMQAMGGVMSITGEVGGDPLPCGAPIADFIGGMQGIIGILLALQARERTGRGQKVEATMLNGMVSAMNIRLAQYWGTGVDLHPQGGGHAQQMPYGTFYAADKPLIIAITTQPFWSAFCECIDRIDLKANFSYITNAKRVENADELRAELNSWFGKRDRDHWLSKLVAAGLPCGPVNSVSELVSNEHVLATRAITSVPLKNGDSVPTVAPPIYLSETPGTLTKVTPSLSADAHAVLQNIGLTDDEIEKLMGEEVVRRPS